MRSDGSFLLNSSLSVLRWVMMTFALCSRANKLVVCGVAWLFSMPVLAVQTVEAWGNNDDEQCTVPVSVGGFDDVAALAGGRYHSIALKTDGTVVTWGGGWGADTNGFPEGLNNFVAIAAGFDHNLALQANGTVVAWGSDNYLQCSVVDGMSNVVAIAAGNNNSVVLQADGTVVARGQYVNYTANVYTTNSTEVIALASGTWHDFALRSDGTLVDLRGGYVPEGLTDIQAIAAGASFGLALQSNGKVVSWSASTPVPEDLTNVVAIAAKGNHSLALTSDETVVAWGSEFFGENTVPEGLSNVVAIAAGVYHSLSLVEYDSETVPMLQITGSVSSVTLSWEPDSPGILLQQADSLSTNTLWTDLPGGSTNSVVIPTAQPEGYFRLYKP